MKGESKSYIYHDKTRVSLCTFLVLLILVVVLLNVILKFHSTTPSSTIRNGLTFFLFTVTSNETVLIF